MWFAFWPLNGLCVFFLLVLILRFATCQPVFFNVSVPSSRERERDSTWQNVWIFLLPLFKWKHISDFYLSIWNLTGSISLFNNDRNYRFYFIYIEVSFHRFNNQFKTIKSLITLISHVYDRGRHIMEQVGMLESLTSF